MQGNAELDQFRSDGDIDDLLVSKRTKLNYIHMDIKTRKRTFASQVSEINKQFESLTLSTDEKLSLKSELEAFKSEQSLYDEQHHQLLTQLRLFECEDNLIETLSLYKPLKASLKDLL